MVAVGAFRLGARAVDAAEADGAAREDDGIRDVDTADVAAGTSAAEDGTGRERKRQRIEGSRGQLERRHVIGNWQLAETS